MSKDIHKWSDGRYVLMFDEHTFFVWDNMKEERMCGVETTKRLNKQQDTIFKLQDICGKSDGENMELRIENKRLQKENEQLRQSQDVKEFSALFNQSIELQREIKDLKEENEQLRQKILITDKN